MKMYIQLQQFITTGVSVPQILEAAITGTPALQTLLVSNTRGPFVQSLERLRQESFITLDIGGVENDPDVSTAKAILEVIRIHWMKHSFCFYSGSPLRSNVWQQAACRPPAQPLLLYIRVSGQQRCQLLGPRLQGTQANIFQALLHSGPATAQQLAHNPNVVPQRFPNPRLRMEAHLRGRRIEKGPSGSDEYDVVHSLKLLCQRHYIVQLTPTTFSIVPLTSPDSTKP